MFDEKIAKVLQLHKSFEYINEKFVVRCFVVVVFFSLLILCLFRFIVRCFSVLYTPFRIVTLCVFSAFSMQLQWYIFSNLNYAVCSLHKKYIQNKKKEIPTQILESREKKNQHTHIQKKQQNIDTQTRYNIQANPEWMHKKYFIANGSATNNGKPTRKRESTDRRILVAKEKLLMKNM